jgi:50S ribosomal protein L16 3-hydroxylase
VAIHAWQIPAFTPAYNDGMKKMTLLGGVTPAQFLRDYWHKKPLLIRQAIPDFHAIVPREALFGLAGRDDVESRLITKNRKKWQVDNGPFDRLPELKRKAWTLLVQGVNLHDDQADTLLRRFRFLPDARLDDLMISYATDEGGVGPHFDSYDVFLLQAEGKRRWQISTQQDLSLIDGVPLKILRDFVPEQEFVLEPGDMLYLPPHVAHDGVAIGECMTYSIGFRAPSWQELGEGFLEFMTDTIDLRGRYADPDLAPTRRPAEISRPMLDTIAAELNKARFTADDVRVFVGEYFSEPKTSVFFTPPGKRLTQGKFLQAAIRRGVKLSPKSRMLYAGQLVFINGESFSMGAGDRKILQTLADERSLQGTSIALASSDVQEALHQWYSDGWIVLG